MYVEKMFLSTTSQFTMSITVHKSHIIKRLFITFPDIISFPMILGYISPYVGFEINCSYMFCPGFSTMFDKSDF